MEGGLDESSALSLVHEFSSNTDKGSSGANELKLHAVVEWLAAEVHSLADIHLIHDEIGETVFHLELNLLDRFQNLSLLALLVDYLRRGH